MRLRACLGGLSLALLGACETLPETLRLELDDRIVLVERKPVPPAPPAEEVPPEDEAADAEPR